jgi:hypothetical protein
MTYNRTDIISQPFVFSKEGMSLPEKTVFLHSAFREVRERRMGQNFSSLESLDQPL